MQLIEVDAEKVKKCIFVMTIMLFHTVIICLNSINIHEYLLNIVGDNLIYHLYYILIKFNMYLTQNINNCKKSQKFSQKPKTCTINRLIFHRKLPLPPCYHAFLVQGQLLKIWHRMLIYHTTWIYEP